MSVDWILRSRS